MVTSPDYRHVLTGTLAASRARQRRSAQGGTCRARLGGLLKF
jgi:hypothetical protein